MLLTRLLNACHHFPGFVYEQARLCDRSKTIEINVRPRRGSRARCLEQRSLASMRAIGVDEIQYGRGHRYLTLVYQIEAGCQRLLWVGKGAPPRASSSSSP